MHAYAACTRRASIEPKHMGSGHSACALAKTQNTHTFAMQESEFVVERPRDPLWMHELLPAASE